MLEGGEQLIGKMSLEEYNAIETKLYGEVIKSCRRYSQQLSLISILGILELVKHEIKDLEKTNQKLMQEDFFEERKEPIQNESEIDPLDRM